jgi:hypothetical protein
VNKQPIDFPCTCGHYNINHGWSLSAARQDCCGVSWCACMDFKPDNLKYLENKLGK